VVLLGVFGYVIGKVALQYLVDLLRRLEPLPPLFGRLMQVITDPFGLQQALALEQPIAAHPTATGLTHR
jgi:hypothetical protein